MTALEHIRRRGKAMAALLLPLLTVVSLDASGACVGMAADAAAAGFAEVVEAHHREAPADPGRPSHHLELAHGPDLANGPDLARSPDPSHGHDDSHRPADTHGPDHSHGHGDNGVSKALHAGVLHEHGDCAHCPSSPAGELDSGHAVCTVSEGAASAAASASAVQWDQKPFLSPIAWIAPPAAASPTPMHTASARATAVPNFRSLQVRYCVLLL